MIHKLDMAILECIGFDCVLFASVVAWTKSVSNVLSTLHVAVEFGWGMMHSGYM